MEHYQPISESPTVDYSSTVDTSRPFTSVKEAVAIFGERILVGEIYSPSPSLTPKPFSFSDTTTNTTTTAIATASYYSPSVSIKRESSSWRSMPSSPSPISPMKSLSFKEEEKNNNNNETLFDTVKKLEEELEKTKRELKILKERGSETEVALATLNAELHKNMSKLAQAEAEAAGKAASKSVRFENIVERENVHRNKSSPQSQTLARIISLGENDDIFGGKRRNDNNNNNNKIRKQKPIVPLVGDLFLFFKRKSSSSTNHHHNNPLYASPF
ncbi:uncharacterized protein LOC131625755 [Vicia villosa]|uniref:uncharacterized protein LOC131625755 n=1 Tax=Vicia villosa TaxID=3911 RepID=UPI00273BC8E7|nr:uncharacterized protein LOC131625755 [Vicia villosa]